MNKRFFELQPDNAQYSRAGFLACAVLFLCGSIAGAVTAGSVSEGTKLNGFVSAFLSLFLTGTNATPDFFAALLDVFKYSLLSVVFGFSILGVFCIPVLMALRGFFLSFSVATIVRVIGGKGVTVALALFGANSLITVPCFFVLSVYAFTASCYIFRIVVSKGAKSAASPFNSRLFLHSGISLSVLFASALIDCYLTPRLISITSWHT